MLCFLVNKSQLQEQSWLDWYTEHPSILVILIL